jgi:regulator of ribonuclease activity B
VQFALLALPLAVIVGRWMWRRRGTVSSRRSGSLDAAGVAELGTHRDLTRPADVDFYLYLPTEGHARSAAAVAMREGYTADVQAPLEGFDSWLCLLSRRMVPSEPAIAAVRERLEELASAFGGEFDGWEAAVD